jgi:hypothetical protein
VRVIRFILLAGLIGCSSTAAPSGAEPPIPARAGSDWPKFLGPNGDGSSPETGILTAWPKEGL